MPNNNQGQIGIPENTDIKSREKSRQPAEVQKAAGQTVASQLAVSADDKTAAQKIQKDLQGGQQTGQPVDGNVQEPNSVSVKKTINDEPYIKAAKNVIERDKNDPYQEEEDHEEVQIQYLKDRFGKNIKKD